MAINLRQALRGLEERVEIVAFVLRGTPAETITVASEDIAAFPEVREVAYVSEEQALGTVLPGRRTPIVAIGFTTLIAAALILIGDLSTLADTTVLLLLLVFAVVNVAVLVLRRETVDHDHFRAPTAIPIIGVGVIVLLLTQTAGKTFAYAAALLGLGVILYGIAHAFGLFRSASAKAPEAPGH